MYRVNGDTQCMTWVPLPAVQFDLNSKAEGKVVFVFFKPACPRIAVLLLQTLKGCERKSCLCSWQLTYKYWVTAFRSCWGFFFFLNCNYGMLEFMFSLFIFWHYLSINMILSIMRLLIRNKIRKKENSQNGDGLWLSNPERVIYIFLAMGGKFRSTVAV